MQQHQTLQTPSDALQELDKVTDPSERRHLAFHLRMSFGEPDRMPDDEVIERHRTRLKHLVN